MRSKGGAVRERVSRGGNESGSGQEGGPPGRNRITERVRGIAPLVGMIVKTGLQDATKNVRIYGTISAASSPFRPSLPPCRHRRRASRIALRCPFTSPPSLLPHPRPDLLYVPLPPSFRETHVGSYFLSSARRCAAPCTLFPSLHVLFRHPHPRSLHSGRKGGPTTRWARTAGRDRPHRRGHHFNVTLIKSNNQYLPRKKF